jgi:hypothetical protein
LRVPGQIDDALGAAPQFAADYEASDRFFHGPMIACSGCQEAAAPIP